MNAEQRLILASYKILATDVLSDEIKDIIKKEALKQQARYEYKLPWLSTFDNWVAKVTGIGVTLGALFAGLAQEDTESGYGLAAVSPVFGLAAWLSIKLSFGLVNLAYSPLLSLKGELGKEAIKEFAVKCNKEITDLLVKHFEVIRENPSKAKQEIQNFQVQLRVVIDQVSKSSGLALSSDDLDILHREIIKEINKYN